MGSRIAGLVVGLALSLPGAARAEVARTDAAARLAQVLQVDQTLDIMRSEGLAYGAELAADLFAGGAGAAAPTAGGPGTGAGLDASGSRTAAAPPGAATADGQAGAGEDGRAAAPSTRAQIAPGGGAGAGADPAAAPSADGGASATGPSAPGQGGAAAATPPAPPAAAPRDGDWPATVAALYDPAEIGARFDRSFRQALPARRIPAMLAFFDTPRGRRIVTLEVSARRALLDPDVSDGAQSLFLSLADSGAPRLRLLRHFARVNRLVEASMAETMRGDAAFYQGLADGHARGFEMTPAQIAAAVAGERAAIRADTEAWLYPYLALAFQPLSDADLRAYIAFSSSPAGRALNGALLIGYDAAFAGISRRLGRAAARHLGGDTL